MYEFDEKVIAKTEELYVVRHLAPIVFGDGFISIVSEHMGSKRAERPPSFRTYVDAFLDLHRLVDEIRFETGLAFLLIDDDARKPRDEEEERSRSQLPYLHDEVVAVALRYAREAPSPVMLFRDPHTRMGGGRVVGTWFAGQLLDSALVRGVAACDRLATLLWARALLPIPERLPAFRPRYLDRLEPLYGHHRAWRVLRALEQDDTWTFAKDLRDRFAHARRDRSALHGEPLGAYFDEPASRGLDGYEHFAVAAAFYDSVLRRAVRVTERLLRGSPAAQRPGGRRSALTTS
jgi:hypothetical protein